MKRLKLKKSIFNTFEPSNLRFRAKDKATCSKFSTFFNERLYKNVSNRIQSFPQFEIFFPINKKILYSFPLLHKTFIYPNSKFNLISNSKFCRSLWFHWKVLFVKCFAVVINFHGIYIESELIYLINVENAVVGNLESNLFDFTIYFINENYCAVWIFSFTANWIANGKKYFWITCNYWNYSRERKVFIQLVFTENFSVWMMSRSSIVKCLERN